MRHQCRQRSLNRICPRNECRRRDHLRSPVSDRLVFARGCHPRILYRLSGHLYPTNRKRRGRTRVRNPARTDHSAGDRLEHSVPTGPYRPCVDNRPVDSIHCDKSYVLICREIRCYAGLPAVNRGCIEAVPALREYDELGHARCCRRIWLEAYLGSETSPSPRFCGRDALKDRRLSWSGCDCRRQCQTTTRPQNAQQRDDRNATTTMWGISHSSTLSSIAILLSVILSVLQWSLFHRDWIALSLGQKVTYRGPEITLRDDESATDTSLGVSNAQTLT